VFCLLAVPMAACQTATVPSTVAPTPTAVATIVPTSRFAPTPGPLLPPLAEADAIALILESAVRYGVAPETIRVSISDEPRRAIVRYASIHALGQTAFELQRILVTMALSRIAARMRPPLDGGLNVGVMPAGGGDVGLFVTVVDGQTLARWSAGEFSDPQFVDQWESGQMTRE
jgi:hypothetical protein